MLLDEELLRRMFAGLEEKIEKGNEGIRAEVRTEFRGLLSALDQVSAMAAATAQAQQATDQIVIQLKNDNAALQHRIHVLEATVPLPDSPAEIAEAAESIVVTPAQGMDETAFEDAVTRTQPSLPIKSRSMAKKGADRRSSVAPVVLRYESAARAEEARKAINRSSTGVRARPFLTGSQTTQLKAVAQPIAEMLRKHGYYVRPQASVLLIWVPTTARGHSVWMDTRRIPPTDLPTTPADPRLAPFLARLTTPPPTTAGPSQPAQQNQQQAAAPSMTATTEQQGTFRDAVMADNAVPSAGTAATRDQHPQRHPHPASGQRKSNPGPPSPPSSPNQSPARMMINSVMNVFGNRGATTRPPAAIQAA